MDKLIIEDDEGRTTVVPLVRDEITIGRKEGNTIRLTERNVSRKHARLVKASGAVCIEDLGSYTGVRVNGSRIVALTPLRDGDQVQIGDYRLAVRPEGAAETLPSMTPALLTPIVPAAVVAAAVGATADAASGAAAPPVNAKETPAYGAVVQRPRLEAAPTTPLRLVGGGTEEAQATAAQAPAAPTAPPARLVIVTTELAGMEFRLDRAAQVIGRTDDNEIVLNHASISRHHAKIIRDGDRYSAIDLQSANGVRVSGQEHERVDLNPGDIVELGHVKARFVGPWETWAYDPREFTPPSGRRKLKIGIAAGGLLLAGVAVVLLQATGKPPAHAPSPSSQASAPPPARPKPVGPPPAQLLADATGAAGEESWDKAITSLDLLISAAPDDAAAAALLPQATELKSKVDLERRAAEIFSAFKQAVTDSDADAALARYEELPEGSLYKDRAATDLPTARRLFVTAHLGTAERARVEGRCDDLKAEVERIVDVDPANKRARELARTCRPRPEPRVAAVAAPASPPPAAAAPRPPASAPRPAAAPAARAAVPAAASVPARSPGPRPASAAPARPLTAARAVVPGRAAGSRAVPATTAAAEPAATEAPAEDPAELIKQAREAWLKQQCPTAIDLSRRALKSRPGSNEANQIIAVCACTLKDKEGAVRSYLKLDERSRGMVRTLCARNGVDLE